MKSLWKRSAYVHRLASATLLDLPRYLFWLAQDGGWVNAYNRSEVLEKNPAGPGWRCNFEWTSGLSACSAYPWLGRRLMAAALRQWPIRLAEQQPLTESPRLSVLLPFRGKHRLPLLVATLKSWLAQQHVAAECIVIEQANQPVAAGNLPAGVRYIHLPHPAGDDDWRKSWALNVGAAAAKTEVLVCHDADILVPQGYAKKILEMTDQGYESLHLQRFLFYVGDLSSAAIVKSGVVGASAPIDVRQNWVGGTLAIRRESYFRIGGFDERFLNWGGEDNEFFDRCMTLRNNAFGFLPFVHLWHEPQANKFGLGHEVAKDFTRKRRNVPPAKRIKELRELHGY